MNNLHNNLKKNNETLNLEGEAFSGKSWHPNKEEWHPDKAKMKLAYTVLYGIFIFLIITIVCSFSARSGYVDGTIISSLFEIFKTGLLPIVTLILGYYFSKNN